MWVDRLAASENLPACSHEGPQQWLGSYWNIASPEYDMKLTLSGLPTRWLQMCWREQVHGEDVFWLRMEDRSRSNMKTAFSGMGNALIKIKRSWMLWDRLTFIMGTHMLVRRYFSIEIPTAMYLHIGFLTFFIWQLSWNTSVDYYRPTELHLFDSNICHFKHCDGKYVTTYN